MIVDAKEIQEQHANHLANESQEQVIRHIVTVALIMVI